VQLSVDPGHGFTGASIMRLIGPETGATAGITLDGRSVDALGRWAPLFEQGVVIAGREAGLHVPAASAALVNFGSG